MYKLFFIAKNNIKKQKGDMITFFILTFLSAFLIFNCASTLLGMGNVMDARFEEIKGAHELLFTGASDVENECAKKAFEDNEHIIDYEATPLIMLYSEYRNKSDKEWQEYQFFMESFDNEKEHMQTLDYDVEGLSDKDILVPYFLNSRFQVGDTLQLRVNDKVYDFNVAGYVEDPYFASSINVTVYYSYISQKMMDTLKDEQPDKALASTVHKGVIDEGELKPTTSNIFEYIYSANNETEYYTTSQLEQEITESYKDYVSAYNNPDAGINYNTFLAVNWQMMRGGAQFLPMIAMAVIFVFAILILVIAIVIISFSIKNFIQRNMKNTGILEASGYTVGELRGALTVQIVLVAFIGAVLGVIVAVLTSAQFGTLVSQVLGLTWNQPVNYSMTVVTVIVLTLLILLVSRGTSRIYKKVTVLDALRGGINTHNFKRNLFPFEKTFLPTSMVLSLKETFGQAGRNILMVFIVIVLTISTLLGFGMMENFGTDPDRLMKIMGFEGGTILVEADEDSQDELLDMDGVENVLEQYGFEPIVSKGDKDQNVYTYAYNDMDKRLNMVLLSGRTAKHDNEIMVTTGVADDFGVDVGDVLKITFADKSEDYIITGIDQRMDRMGRGVSMTFEGAKKLLPGLPTIQYMITGKDGMTFDKLNDKVTKLKDVGKINVAGTMDIDKNLHGTLTSVNVAMKMLCIIISIVTILVVVFVEALVIRAKIVREWRSFGISKALGMTSGQLILQIMMSNVPVILAGTVIGALLSESFGSKACIASFSLFGIKQMTFSISPIWQLVTIVGILAVALITAGLFGLKIRTLNPVAMITEE
ncbi:MAG: ABC transporter permease [Lachnospiraceae bacterium]|nr:ABC transporter permease [Lachnospiraceae bacterium]